MEENNVKEEVKVKEEENGKTTKSNQVVIALLALIIVFLVGCTVYYNFIKKEDGGVLNNVPPTVDNGTNNNTTTPTPSTNTENNTENTDTIPAGIYGKYVNNGFENDYFVLNEDGTAEATIIFTGEVAEGAKTTFTKEELTYAVSTQGENVFVELVPSDSLNTDYKQMFGAGGSYYYSGKLVNGVYEFKSINGSAVASPETTIYVKQ